MTEPTVGGERRSWTQPLCRSCFAAWSLGQGASPHRTPVELREDAVDAVPCSEPTRIWIRVDPALTEGLLHAQLKSS